jgi:hypothetical protein
MLALKRFFLLWLSTALTLWIVDGLLDGLSFSGLESLLLASLVLCALVISLVGALVSIATGQVRVWGRVGRFDSSITGDRHHRASAEDHRVIDGEFKEKKSDQDQLPR